MLNIDRKAVYFPVHMLYIGAVQYGMRNECCFDDVEVCVR